MKLIDRISIHRLITTLLNFILTLVDKLKAEKSGTEKKKRRWRKYNE